MVPPVQLYVPVVLTVVLACAVKLKSPPTVVHNTVPVFNLVVQFETPAALFAVPSSQALVIR